MRQLVSPRSLDYITLVSYFLLFHELGIWAIVDHIAPKNGCCQWRIDFLSTNVTQLAIQDKLVALGS